MKTLSKIAVIACLAYLAASCRSEDGAPPPRIEKVVFEEQKREIFVGDIVTVNISAQPFEAKSHDKIVYRASEFGIIEIMAESGNDGVVFKGLKRGTTVITASTSGGTIDYLQVVVLGGNESVVPHIKVSDYIFECLRGENRSVVASLAGGTPLDESGFVWSYTGQDRQIIDFVWTNNIGVFDTRNAGESVITVSHPKAQFSVNILVFVTERNDVPVYITTDNNVINLKTTDEVFEYSVNLYNSSNSNDNYGFMHEILDGSDVIGLRANNNIGTVTPKKRGIARIGVSHQKASHRMEIIVIVSEEVVYNYIELDSTLVILEEGWQKTVEAVMVGNVPPDHLNSYEFENENNDVVSLESSQNIVTIRALKKGRSVITVKNEPYADFNREILVIVHGAGEVVDREMYITTNQNVITTEVNGEAELTMTLVGGNSADANNFIWTVEDGSVIEVTHAHGEVRYRNRAAIGNTDQKFEAVAVIKAKKIGTTKITLENPKSRNDFSVIVKVYKQGVFGVVPVVVTGNSLYQINKGESANVYLRVVTGLEKSLANFSWESDNSSVFTVESEAGLTGLLKGRDEGVATLTISADNMKNKYVATVVVSGNGNSGVKPYIYTQNGFMSVVKGSSATFRVECANMDSAQIAALQAVNNDPDKIEMFAYRNNITVKGLEFGSADIVISGEGLNTLMVRVTVEDYALTPETPYYLRTDKYIYGAVKGRRIEVPVDLVGGIARNEKDIVWEIVDSNVASIDPAGKKCLITGKNEGQTILKVRHPQSNNELEIVIYVVLSENELTSKIIMHVSDQNVLLTLGQTRYVSIITNASQAQQNAFQWNYTNPNVISVSPSADKIKAYISAKEAGNATISIKSGNQIPVVIYVSVTNNYFPGAYINVPSIVEMVAGQTVTVNAVLSGISDKYNIKWQSVDEKMVKAFGNGEVCTITAYKGPKAKITVTYNDFVKDIMVYIYDSLEEMMNAYVFAAEQNRYVINKDDIIKVGLVFGMKGYPEHMEQNIRWTTQDRMVIHIEENGKSAGIRGLREGVGTVNISDNFGNSTDIEIVVREVGKPGQYSFSVKKYGKSAGGEDRIAGIVAGSYIDLEVKVFNGTNEITNISGIEYELDGGEVFSWEEKPFGIRVKAAAGKEGSGYITLRHNSVEDARILVYSALSEMGLAEAFPLLIEKTNYLLKKNDSVTVLVNTLPDNGSRLRNISYDLEKDNGVLNIQERSKTEIVIKAEKTGSEVVRVRYNAQIVQRIYVSVVDENFGSSNGYLVTENIIAIVAGETYNTRVDTNVSTGIFWGSENDYICSVAENNRTNAVLKGESEGKTYVTVRAGTMERKIAVFVVNDAADLNALEAVNIEQRKYSIRKNDNITISVHSYQGKVKGTTVYEDYYKYSNPYGNVITVNSSDNGKISVRGLNEGTAAIRIKNEYYHEEFIVYVEVYFNQGEGETGVVTNKHYITAEKTLYIIDEREENVYVSVGVIGGDFYGDNEWVWQVSDNSIIDVNALGRGALVNPLKRGTAKIQVINSRCENNPFEITVIVGDRFEIDNDNLPYIYVERDLYEIIKNDGTFSIPYRIENVTNINTKNIFFDIVGGNIDVRHDVTGGVFNVTPMETGIGKFVIKYGNLRREVHVLVKENINTGNIFLTTSENYVIASIGELRTLNIQLAGYSELDSSKLEWKISDASPRNVIQLSGNGTIGEIYGVSEGDVVINVRHVRDDVYKAFNTLTINVKIVKDKSKERVVYLTTQKNVIETVKGSQSEIIYIQKIGGDVTVSKMTWSSSNESVVTLQEIQGSGARIIAHNEGEARITVRNDEARYALEIVVIVRQALNNNVYISSAETLIWLTPGEVNRRISAQLVNGDSKYNNNFIWSIDSQSPSDEKVKKDNGKVISIVSSNEACFISTVNEGVAYLRVENPGRAEKALIITIYVSHFSKIKFSVDRKELVIGEYEFVSLELPTYENLKDRARVWVEDVNGGISDLLDVYYTNSLVLLNGREEALGGRDEGFAVVKAALEGKDEGYAQMLVHVVKKVDPNVNRVVVGKNIHVMSLKSDTFILNASVVGPHIFDNDLDALRWEIVQNDNGDITRPFITMIPQNDGGKKTDYDEKGKPFSYDASGRMVQISIKNQGTVLLRVMHAKVPREFWKDIYIIIDDMGNYFTINKKELTVNPSREFETVSVNIVGGTTQDYAQVRWVTKMQQKWDGTLLEIVRIVGSGREVMLLPLNDGVTDIYAFYNGNFVKCEVSVVSDYYLDFRAETEYMFPGETRDLPFDIRPGSSNINWIPNGPVMLADNKNILVTHFEVSGSPAGGQGTPQRYLRVMAMNEGTGTLVAMANGKVARVNFIVAFDYQFVLNGGAGRPKSRQSTPAYSIKNPNHGKDSPNIPQSSDGVIEVFYYVYPTNTYIEPVQNTIPAGLTVEVIKQENTTDSKGRILGTGVIKFTGAKEMTATVKFQQYKATLASEQKEPVEDGEREFTVIYKFENHEIFPYFMRGDGVHSNTASNNGTRSPVPYGDYVLKMDGAKYPGIAQNIGKVNNEYTLDLVDGEVHHILFDKYFENMDVGVIRLNVEKKNGIGNPDPNNNNNNTYKYKIAFDQNKNPALKAAVEGRKDKLPWPVDTDEQLKDFTYEVQLVDVSYNGIEQKAVRLSGGKDYIEYTRVAFPQKLYMYVKSLYYNGNVRTIMRPADFEGKTTKNVTTNVVFSSTAQWYQTVQRTKAYVLMPYSYYWAVDDGTRTFIDDYMVEARTADVYEVQPLSRDYLYIIKEDLPNTSSFQKIVSDYCRTISVQLPQEYYYTYDVYNRNKSELDEGFGRNYDNLVFDRFKSTALGGYFITYKNLGGGVWGSMNNSSRTVYGYDRGEIIEHISKNVPIYYANTSRQITGLEIVKGWRKDEVNCTDENKITVINGWPYGYVNEQVYENMGEDYDPSKIYSTENLKYAKEEVESFLDGAEKVSKYDVFGEKVLADGVLIDVPKLSDIGSDYDYGSTGASTFGPNCVSSFGQYFLYKNMYGNNRVHILAHRYNGGNGLYNYLPGGQCWSSTGDLSYWVQHMNIFGRNSDWSIAYGEYSILYSSSYTRQWHDTNNALITGTPFNDFDYQFSEINSGINSIFGECILRLHTTFESGFLGIPKPVINLGHDGWAKILPDISSAQQKLEWGTDNRKTVVPYYVFNRFPYKVVDKMFGYSNQVVKLDDGGGTPMPSVMRDDLFITDQLRITIEHIDINGKTQSITINVNLKIKACHNMYNGGGITDSSINDSTAEEVEGEVYSFRRTSTDDTFRKRPVKIYEPYLRP